MSSLTQIQIAELRKVLCSEESSLASRFRSLFSLKHIAAHTEAHEDPDTLAAIDAIAAALSSSSALLKHELAYCLGQTHNRHAIEPLRKCLSNLEEDPMCRHEAAEALGALGYAENLDILKEFRDRPGEDVVITETCEIAIDRVEWENSLVHRQEKLRQSDFSSIDPAPPIPETNATPDVDEFGKILLDTSLPLFKRYRAMFALRDLASPPDLPTAVSAILTLAKGLNDTSALFRHEIAFVFGQLSHPASIPALIECLSNIDEVSMVRHEAAEALGGLGEEDGVEGILKRFLNDKEQVVRDSVIVALDMAEYEKSGQTEYAIIPKVAAN